MQLQIHIHFWILIVALIYLPTAKPEATLTVTVTDHVPFYVLRTQASNNGVYEKKLQGLTFDKNIMRWAVDQNFIPECLVQELNIDQHRDRRGHRRRPCSTFAGLVADIQAAINNEAVLSENAIATGADQLVEQVTVESTVVVEENSQVVVDVEASTGGSSGDEGNGSSLEVEIAYTENQNGQVTRDGFVQIEPTNEPDYRIFDDSYYLGISQFTSWSLSNTTTRTTKSNGTTTIEEEIISVDSSNFGYSFAIGSLIGSMLLYVAIQI